LSAGLEIRLLIAKERIVDKILHMPKGDAKLLDIYYILLLNLVRILPYTTDNYTKSFVNAGIETVIKQILEMEVNK
jgi:hypothetical protein